VEPRLVPLKPGNYRLTAERLAEFVDENTTCVVAIAGQTFTGEDDDIQEIQAWLDAYEKRTGHYVPMHIDAASGGFVNPFLYPDYAWDFRLPRVKSINTSGHKFGLVYPGLGWLVFRERSVFPEELVFYVNYLGGEAPTATLNFSKGAATVLMQYYQILRLGRDGYTRVMQHALDNSLYLRDRLLDTGKFDLLNQTQRIPVVALSLKPDVKRFNEFDISNKVRERGWVVSAYTMPPDAQEVRTLRIVVRPHLNHDCIEILAQDLEQALEYLQQHGGTATPPALHDAEKHSLKC
jgi:glutamate decarboxylase